MTRHRDAARVRPARGRLAIFTDAERVIADPVVRNRGTIGGALCQADPSEDLSAVCAAVGAQLVIRGAQRRARGRHARVPPRPVRDGGRAGRDADRDPRPRRAGSGSAYEKVDRRVGDWAVAAAGAAVDDRGRDDRARRRRARRGRRRDHVVAGRGGARRRAAVRRAFARAAALAAAAGARR